MSDEYFRRDRKEGITPPDLSKPCSYAEHVVRARGKRTKFTSVSIKQDRIRDFGDTLYRLLQEALSKTGHVLIEHNDLVRSLDQTIIENNGRDRDLALRAIRRVKSRSEGLVDWRFNTSGVERKDLIVWASDKVNAFFTKV